MDTHLRGYDALQRDHYVNDYHKELQYDVS
jgi:hypothetical protein